MIPAIGIRNTWWGTVIDSLLRAGCSIQGNCSLPEIWVRAVPGAARCDLEKTASERIGPHIRTSERYSRQAVGWLSDAADTVFSNLWCSNVIRCRSVADLVPSHVADARLACPHLGGRRRCVGQAEHPARPARGSRPRINGERQIIGSRCDGRTLGFGIL